MYKMGIRVKGQYHMDHLPLISPYMFCGDIENNQVEKSKLPNVHSWMVTLH